MSDIKRPSHVVLTSHHNLVFKDRPQIHWGAKTARERGPIVGATQSQRTRNVIGSHGGGYSIYRALSIAAGRYPEGFRSDLENTHATTQIGPFDSWCDPDKIVSIDPWGARVVENFGDYLDQGYSISPTIAVTQAHLTIPELTQAIDAGRLPIDDKIVTQSKNVCVTKVAMEPVWYLPGIAKRIGIDVGELRKILFTETGGIFPELVTRPDLNVLLPPIGSTTVYIFGEPHDLANPAKELTCRVHDECNGSDVFGSDICTCRPYLVHGIEEAVKTAQRGGVGIVVYFRKEGRALGEVTKFLVYNARKRQTDGDSADYLFREDTLRCRCRGRPLPGAHARSAALVRHHQDRQPDVDEQHEIRRDCLERHQGYEPPRDSRSPRAAGRARRARRETRGRLLLCEWQGERIRRLAGNQGPSTRRVTASVEPIGWAMPHTPGADAVLVDRLLSAAAVRAGARGIFDLAAAGGTHFSLHLERLDDVADYTIAVTRENYPDLKVPFHSRHGHLRAGGIDRPGQLAAAARGTGVDEPVRSMIDLVVVSVLLDAGAGDRWAYRERSTGRTFSRSEGLAVASFEMFMAGAFCGHRAPRADVAGLCAITPADLERGFHVTPDNPLVGVAGRAALLKALGESMANAPRVFPRGRISDLLDHLTSGSEVAAIDILDFVLRRLGGIWPNAIDDSRARPRRCLALPAAWQPGRVSQALAMAHLLARGAADGRRIQGHRDR